jgi:hypothetical protein
MSFFPVCFTVIHGAPRCSQACHWCSETCHRHSRTRHQHSQTCHWRSQNYLRRSHKCPGATNGPSSIPKCSQTYHNHSHGSPVLLPSATCNCIIMLTFWLLIHFQHTAIAPKVSSKGKEMTRAKMPTSVINRCLGMLDQLQKRIFHFMKTHERLDKYNAIWLCVPANHDLTPKIK